MTSGALIATAVGLFNSVIGLVFVYGSNYLSRRLGERLGKKVGMKKARLRAKAQA